MDQDFRTDDVGLRRISLSSSPYLAFQFYARTLAVKLCAGAVLFFVRSGNRIYLVSVWDERKKHASGSLRAEVMRIYDSIQVASARNPGDVLKDAICAIPEIAELGDVLMIPVPFSGERAFEGKDRGLIVVVVGAPQLCQDLCKDPTRRDQLIERLGLRREELLKTVGIYFSYVAFQTALCCALNSKDPYTLKHSLHVATYAKELAVVSNQLNCTCSKKDYLDHDAVMAYNSGLIHDIGKIKTPLELLWKPTSYIGDEKRLVDRHPFDGYALIQSLDLPEREDMGNIVLEHHSLPPKRGKDNKVILERTLNDITYLIRMADVFDAMTTDRPYRRALSEGVVDTELISRPIWGGEDAEDVERQFRVKYGACQGCRKAYLVVLKEINRREFTPREGRSPKNVLVEVKEDERNRAFETISKLFDLVVTKNNDDTYWLSVQEERELDLVRAVLMDNGKDVNMIFAMQAQIDSGTDLELKRELGKLKGEFYRQRLNPM